MKFDIKKSKKYISCFLILLIPGIANAADLDVCFQTSDGEHVVTSVLNAPHPMWADRADCNTWENHTIVDLNGGQLLSGDTVAIKTHWGINGSAHVWSSDPHNYELYANRTEHQINDWEKFTIQKLNGSGEINIGSTISLKSFHNRYVVALQGGGDVLRANRFDVGEWEKFVLLPPNTTRLPNRDVPCTAEPTNGFGFNVKVCFFSQHGQQGSKYCQLENYRTNSDAIPAGGNVSIPSGSRSMSVEDCGFSGGGVFANRTWTFLGYSYDPEKRSSVTTKTHNGYSSGNLVNNATSLFVTSQEQHVCMINTSNEKMCLPKGHASNFSQAFNDKVRRVEASNWACMSLELYEHHNRGGQTILIGADEDLSNRIISPAFGQFSDWSRVASDANVITPSVWPCN